MSQLKSPVYNCSINGYPTIFNSARRYTLKHSMMLFVLILTSSISWGIDECAALREAETKRIKGQLVYTYTSDISETSVLVFQTQPTNNKITLHLQVISIILIKDVKGDLHCSKIERIWPYYNFYDPKIEAPNFPSFRSKNLSTGNEETIIVSPKLQLAVLYTENRLKLEILVKDPL